ncbi:hypothetical protein [Streptomyces niveus]|uniref:hypothetical protein n=1 Tax=Streptomyces niveus TaxID=193462 RepID=UPI00341490B1
MNHLPLSVAETGAVALTMQELTMLLPVGGTPKEPALVPGREGDCIAAQLGMTKLVGVSVDDDIKSYLDAHQHFVSWHPDRPTGISAHKLTGPGWIIGAAEVRAAVTVLGNAKASAVRSARHARFTAADVEESIWDDWTKLLHGSADSGYPILMAAPEYDGPMLVAELLLEQGLRSV